MCGIFGFVANPNSKLNSINSRRILIDLFHRSEPRGRDASGLVAVTNGHAAVYKRPLPPDRFLSEKGFRQFLSKNMAISFDEKSGKLISQFAAIGHCRLVLSGTEVVHANNQPVISGPIVGIHNGLITNESELIKKHKFSHKRGSIDSEIIFRIINQYCEEGNSIRSATAKCFNDIEGTASIAFLRQGENQIILATNYGSIYISRSNGLVIFASEKAILESLIGANKSIIGACSSVESIEADTGKLISLETTVCDSINLSNSIFDETKSSNGTSGKIVEINDWPSDKQIPKRCVRCILPRTYPFIDFDKTGTCNYCRDYVVPELFGESALECELDKHRRSDGSPDCLVGFSGGRDSSYGLHLLKNKYKMNPIAFSYDWGMVTDISRRNQARICSQLKIEQVLRAANIPAKRRYMRKNIEAWLRRPHLGMVPLFMAGDKFFYSIARQLREQMKIPLVVFCAGNPLERTDFKGGFAGLRESNHAQRLYAFPVYHKLKIGVFYLTQYILNPSYFNESFFESVMSFFTTFVAKDDFLYLYQYIPWDEQELENTLLNDYGWEKASYSENTWRIGDGYTTFINYIFFNIAGFSEFDTFRSQQIRAGIIDRNTALKLANQDNRYDMDTLKEFMGQVGLNLEEVLTRIGDIPKLY